MHAATRHATCIKTVHAGIGKMLGSPTQRSQGKKSNYESVFGCDFGLEQGRLRAVLLGIFLILDYLADFGCVNQFRVPS